MKRAIRIANASGFFGDRASALADMAACRNVDVITGDYLAEVTMFVLAKLRSRDPEAGHATAFLDHLRPALADLVAHATKVVVNAGGLNPDGMATALRALLDAEGVNLRVATVTGDDIIELVRSGGEWPHKDTGAPLSSWQSEPTTANAYLGGWGIAAALAEGADIVICGRVADASLVVGAAAWWHEWQPDDWNALAGALVAGHVIECGTQATGGNYSGFAALEPFLLPGFPIAEIDADGSSVITKPDGTDGAVTVGTVTAQLVYEIQDLDYLNADVTARLDTVQVHQDSADRVLIHGVEGGPPPHQLKVAMTGVGGWRNSVTFALTGLDIDRKQALLESQVAAAVTGELPGIDAVHVERIGGTVEDPRTRAAATALMRVTANGTKEAAGKEFSRRLVGICLSSVPGLYLAGPPGNGSAYGTYWPSLVERNSVHQHVVLDDGRQVEPTQPPSSEPPLPRWTAPRSVAALLDSAEATITLPLGLVADARSGDKGGNANLGVWVPSESAWVWLRDFLTVEVLRTLLPEVGDLSIDRAELPHLYAVNFVVHGLLGAGATATSLFDSQAKALGEYLLARHVDIPDTLVNGARLLSDTA